MNFASMKNYKRIAASVGLATLMTVAVAAPAFAASDTGDVGVEVTGGAARTVTLGNAVFDAYTYSLVGTTIYSSTDAAMQVIDESGGVEGWTITMSTDGLFATGQDPQQDVPVIAPDLVSVTPGTVVQGPNTTEAQALELSSTTGSLASDRAVLTAEANEGLGTFNVDINVAIAMPDRLAVDTYTGVLTVTDGVDV